MMTRLAVVTKNSTGKLLTDHSDKESEQLCDWMAKGVTTNFPSMAKEMAKTPKEQKPKDFQAWMQEMVTKGKQFERDAKLFGDYSPFHPLLAKVTVKELLADT